MRDESALYYECHITIEPNPKLQLTLENIAGLYGFRAATFDMKDPDGAPPKAFISCRDKSYASICNRMSCICEDLKEEGLVILRYKIEDTLIDSKHGKDILGLLP